MKTWVPGDAVRVRIERTPVMIRSHQPEALLETATFKRAGPVASLFGMTGITFRPNHIVLSRDLCDSADHRLQAQVVFHELVHLAQVEDEGILDFRADYIWQWIRAGGSYEKMKTFGLEKEAFELEEEFVRSLW